MTKFYSHFKSEENIDPVAVSKIIVKTLRIKITLPTGKVSIIVFLFHTSLDTNFTANLVSCSVFNPLFLTFVFNSAAEPNLF